MAYSKYATELKDKDGNIYGVMDAENREDTAALKSAINSIHQIPAGGTSGQILTKASGTNYDVQWSPVGMPSDTQVDDAVSDWLDDHPEATTTVEDGSITKVKLHSNLAGEIEGKAPAITESIEDKHSFSASETSGCSDYKLNVPQTSGVATAYIAPCEDALPPADTKTFSSGFWSMSGNTVVGDGEASGNFAYHYVNNSSHVVPKKTIKANDTVTLRLAKLSGSITAESASYTEPLSYSLRLEYTDDTYLQTTGGEFKINALYHERTLTAEKEVASIVITFYARPNYTFSDFTMRWAMVVNSSFTSYDLSNDLEISKSVLGTNGISILPVDGSLTCIADTKTYVDSHIPEDMLIKEDLVYVTPEMFESSRTSNSDDYAVIAACLTYAIAHNVPVRGFGNYTISQGIVIEADDADIFFNSLTTQMQSGAVVTLTGYRNRLKINKIYAYDGNCVGFRLYGKYNHWTEYNTIILPYIFTKKDCILVDCLNQTSGDAYACENKLYTQYLRSVNENCINSANGYGENQFYGGGQIICPNGWAIYELCSGNKYFNFALESYARSGVYCFGHNNYFTGFRIAELRGQKTLESGDVGTVIKFVGWHSFANIMEFADCINLVDIDVSEATSNDDLDINTDDTCQLINIVRACGVRGYKYDTGMTTGYCTLYGKEVITLRNKKIVTPIGLLQRDVDDDIDYATDEYKEPFANWFTIKAASTITLNDSYCPIGFNEIYIDQTDAKVTIYKGGTVIFDGTQYGNSLYKLVCYCDMANNIFLEHHTQLSYPVYMYDGENEVWNVLEA